MKKAIFLFFAALTFLISSAQQSSSYSVFKSQMGRWNTYLKDWIWDSPTYSTLTITIYSNTILVDDKAHSVYTIFKDEGETSGYNKNGNRYKEHSWKCYDEVNRTVLFSIIIYDDVNVCSVMYNDLCYRYYIRKAELSNFNN